MGEVKCNEALEKLNTSASPKRKVTSNRTKRKHFRRQKKQRGGVGTSQEKQASYMADRETKKRKRPSQGEGPDKRRKEQAGEKVLE